METVIRGFIGSVWRFRPGGQLQYIHCGLHASKNPVPVLVHNVGGWHLP
jgi:hypothetical protein